jgi:Zn-dependent protease with chaperone function
MQNVVKSAFIAVLAVLVIPCAAFAVAEWRKDELNTAFLSAVGNKDTARIAELKQQGVTFAGFCATDYENKFSEICELLHTQENYELAVFAALGLGLGAILLSIFVPMLAGRSRGVLATVFSPTVRIVTFAVGVAIALQGLLAAYGIYLVETTATGRYHVKIIAIMGIAGVIAGGLVLKSTFSIFRQHPTLVLGRKLLAEEQPRFFERLKGLCSRLGAVPPAHVVVGLEPNFYVTANPVRLVSDGSTLAGNTLYLSTPLCRAFTGSELDAVVGHELGHFVGEDTAYTMRFAPAYTTLEKAIGGIAEQSRHGGMGAIFSSPALAMLNLCMFQFAKVERRIGRQRELEADKAGSSVSSNRALATALLKVAMYASLWPAVQKQNITNLEAGNAYKNLTELFAFGTKAVHEESDAAALVKDLESRTIVHPIDTHPPTALRLQAMGVEAASISKEELAPASADSAAALFDNLDAIEEELTLTEHRWLVATHQAILPEAEKPNAEGQGAPSG